MVYIIYFVKGNLGKFLPFAAVFLISLLGYVVRKNGKNHKNIVMV